jgi:hypothetical protein
MFSHMVSEIKNGRLPDKSQLRKRFEAALIKKIGVIKTPYSFWPADTKINPPAKQLLWAAILLQDKENFHVIEAIISTELEEKLRAKGKGASIKEITDKVQALRQEYLQELVDLAPEPVFTGELQRLILTLADNK